MKKDDLVYICAMTANLSGLPVRLCEGDRLLSHFSMTPLPRDPILLVRPEITAIDRHVGFYISKRFYVYGVVSSGNHRIVIGPTRQAPPQDQELREIAFELDVAQDDLSEFISGMKQITRLPLESLIQMLCFLNFVVNGEKLRLNDLIEGGENRFGLEQSRSEQRFKQDEPDAETLHNTLAIEQMVMNIIRKGDVAALEAFAQDAPAVIPGNMAPEQLRQAKNTFIVTVTEASRSAIRGGMDVEDALKASDAYIQQCEMLTDIHQITKLNYDMVLYYTQRVQAIRHGHYATDLVRNVALYIQHHLSETITTDQIAAHLFMSRQHLSRRFTQEAGIPLAAYIRNEQTEEAKRLLRYTDKSISSIALFLGFSSQGHFSKVFKEITSMTPGEYREKKQG